MPAGPLDRLLRTTGTTSLQLAALADVDVAALSAPNTETLRRVAATMGMRLSEVLTGAPPPGGGLY
jgi:hypothetical protein